MLSLAGALVLTGRCRRRPLRLQYHAFDAERRVGLGSDQRTPRQDTMGSGIRAHEAGHDGRCVARTQEHPQPATTERRLAVLDRTFGHDVSNWQPNINWTEHC